MKIVRSAATDDRTGEVSEMRTRKEPENARRCDVSFRNLNGKEGYGYGRGETY
jgi:hypothetical protein